MFLRPTFILAIGVLASFQLYANGDSIRGDAPVTALVLDLRAGNLEPLEDAYFNEEIDFFLDYKGVQNTVARELYFLREAGRAVARGDVVAAQGFLGSVQKYKDEKDYLSAVILAAQGRYEEAQRAFLNLIERRHSLSKRLQTLSYLGAARVAHEVGDFSQAIFYYTQVPQLDPRYFQSVFEKGWSFYMDGDMNGALGASLMFTTPYAEHVFYPEAEIVRAAAFFHMCYFERANAAIEQMKRSFVPIQKQIKDLLGRSNMAWIFDDRILKSVSPRLLGYMIGDTSFRRSQRALLRLQEEAGRLGKARSSTTAEAVKFIRAKMMRDAGRVLREANRDLNQALEQADSIQIEILQSGVNLLVGAPVEMREDIRVIELGDVDFDPLIQFWPFEGEFWADEIGSYYYGLKSACGETKGLSLKGSSPKKLLSATSARQKKAEISVE